MTEMLTPLPGCLLMFHRDDMLYGYGRRVSSYQWSKELRIAADHLGLKQDDLPFIGTPEFICCHAQLGNTNPFYVLGDRLWLWIIRYAEADGTPDYGGYVVLQHRLAGGLIAKSRLAEAVFKQQIMAKMPANLTSEKWLAAYHEIGEGLHSEWWRRWILANVSFISAVKNPITGP